MYILINFGYHGDVVSIRHVVIAGLNEEVDADGDADVDDQMIGDYLASQLGDDLDWEPDGLTVPRQWPKGRSSKLLDQTLYVLRL